MAKKQSKKEANEATFEVRFVAPGLHPDDIPLRAVNEALSAVQDIASGRDPYEMASVPTEKSIGLVNVRRGSAIYDCVSRAPAEAVQNLSRLGVLMASTNGDADWDELSVALSPIKSLSEVARSLGCRLEVRVGGRRSKPLVAFGSDDYGRISSRLLVEGETSVFARVVRVGGKTETRCMLQIPGRHRALFCNVQGKALARRLGEHLYEDIVATGTAVWLHRTWRIHRFTIKDFSQPELGDPADTLRRLREAGLSAWDDVEDPEEFIAELRT